MRTDTLQDQLTHWAALEERATHAATMRPLSPLESQWLDDYRAHFASREIVTPRFTD